MDFYCLLVTSDNSFMFNGYAATRMCDRKSLSVVARLERRLMFGLSTGIGNLKMFTDGTQRKS